MVRRRGRDRGAVAIDGERVGYLGLSMGTRFGVDMAPRFAVDAPRVTVPLLFHVPWDDEIFPQAGQLELFDRAERRTS